MELLVNSAGSPSIVLSIPSIFNVISANGGSSPLHINAVTSLLALCGQMHHRTRIRSEVAVFIIGLGMHKGNREAHLQCILAGTFRDQVSNSGP